MINRYISTIATLLFSAVWIASGLQAADPAFQRMCFVQASIFVAAYWIIAALPKGGSK